ncbi:MAG: hypothetical protein HN344_01575 [Gammaproteobacteria bacterium]|nr:hypothetical protein [Gammaproteobacteria bacterium]
MRLQLPLKLSLLTLFIAGGGLLSLGVLVWTDTSRLLEEEALGRLQENVNQGRTLLGRAFDTVEGDLHLLRQSQAITGLIRAIEGGGG